MRLCALLLLLFGQDDFGPRQAAFEQEAADRLLMQSARLDEAGEPEAAQVLAAFSAWLAPGDSRARDAEARLRRQVQEMTAPKGRSASTLRSCTDPFTDSLRGGPLMRLATSIGPLRKARTGLNIDIGFDKITLDGDKYRRASDGKNLIDVSPPALVFAFDDEMVVCEGGKLAVSPKSDDAVRSGRDAMCRRANGLALEGVRLGHAAGAQRLLVVSQMLFTLRHSVRALWRFNDHRLNAGQKASAYSMALSYNCFLHAQYLAFEKPEHIEGLKMHDEREASPWFTEEGRKTGLRSVISSASVDYAVDELIATLYHRIPMVAPGVETVGIGEWVNDGQPRTVIDARGGAARATGVVLVPADGQEGVFTRFPSREIPDPLPEQTFNAGWPLTISFHGTEVPKGVKATLLDTRRDEYVECWVSSPDRPANPMRPENSHSICVISKKALKANTTYTLKASGTIAGEERRWSVAFKTRTQPFNW